MTQVAKFKKNVAPIASEFGENLARKWFGDDAVDALPIYVKGEKKGQKKGWLTWEKCIEGGWVYPDAFKEGFNVTRGYVAKPSKIRYKAIEVDHQVVTSLTCQYDPEIDEQNIDELIESVRTDLAKRTKHLEIVRERGDEMDEILGTVESFENDIRNMEKEIERLEEKKRFGAN